MVPGYHLVFFQPSSIRDDLLDLNLACISGMALLQKDDVVFLSPVGQELVNLILLTRVGVKPIFLGQALQAGEDWLWDQELKRWPLAA